MSNLDSIQRAVERLARLKGERPYRVLNADDQEGARISLKLSLKEVALLKTFNLEIHEAKDGVEAMQKLQADDYDYAFMDVSMPRMDGVQVFKSIMRTKPDHVGRFIFVTGHDDFPALEAALDDGALEILRKPVEAKHLLKFFP